MVAKIVCKEAQGAEVGTIIIIVKSSSGCGGALPDDIGWVTKAVVAAGDIEEC